MTTPPQRVAFIILAHGETTILARLAARLTSSPVTVGVVIHYDKKSGPLDEGVTQSERLAIVGDPVDVQWGHWSIVEAVARSVRVLDAGFPSYDWVVLLSGQDYPVRPLADLASFLSESRVDAYIECQQAADNWGEDEVRHRYGYDYATLPRWLPGSQLCALARRLEPIVTSYRLDGGTDRIGLRRRRDTSHLLGGSDWFMARRDAVAAIVRDAQDRSISSPFRRTVVPSETFYASVLDRRGYTIGRDGQRYYRFAGQTSPHPETLTQRDLAEVLASGAYFARKLEPRASADLLDALDDQH